MRYKTKETSPLHENKINRFIHLSGSFFFQVNTAGFSRISRVAICRTNVKLSNLLSANRDNKRQKRGNQDITRSDFILQGKGGHRQHV